MGRDAKGNPRRMDNFDRLLLVNDRNIPDPIQVDVPLHRLLDQNWCDAMSNSLHVNVPWTVREATSALGDYLPDSPGIYMFVWRTKFKIPTNFDHEHRFRIILYVGKAGGEGNGSTLQKRFKSEYTHLIGVAPEMLWQRTLDSREKRLGKLLNVRDLEYWYHEISRADLIEYFETCLIDAFNPPGNFKEAAGRGGRISGKLKSPVPAF